MSCAAGSRELKCPGTDQLQLYSRERGGGTSPERIGISGVLWSTLWGCVCVQLGKIHGHSSLFRLQQSGTQKDSNVEQKTLLDEDKESEKSFHAHSQQQQNTHHTVQQPVASSSAASSSSEPWRELFTGHT